MATDETKKAIREYFSKAKYKAGDDKGRFNIMDAYQELHGELPPIQYMRESEGDFDKYAEVLLKCLQSGKPYEMNAKDKSEMERLDAEGVPHDGFY